MASPISSVLCALTDQSPGIELVLYFRTMRIFIARRAQPHKSDMFYAIFSTVMLILITIWITSPISFGQKMWLLDRSYPGGPMAYHNAYSSSVYMSFARFSVAIQQQMADGLMVRLGGEFLARDMSLNSLRSRFTAAGLFGGVIVPSSCRRFCG